MNTARRLTPLTLIAATLATVFLLHEARAATPVVQLEPVHVTAERVSASGAAGPAAESGTTPAGKPA